jgi:hypothetical protein
MKLPKTLLTAIMIGIAVQTTSCTKDKEIPDAKRKEVKKEQSTPVSCPACGMG